MEPLFEAAPPASRLLQRLLVLTVVAIVCALAFAMLHARGAPGGGAAAGSSPAHIAVLNPLASQSSATTWPGGVVLFANEAPDQEWAVAQAVQAWNSSGANVHFEQVPPSQADVVISHDGIDSCTRAEATVGDVPDAHVDVFQLDNADPACSSYGAAVALAHEFGHVLGLEHVTGECSIMNPVGSYRGPQDCTQLDAWQWDCGLLEAGDVARVAALYGGTPVARGPRGCPLYDAVASPAALQLDKTGDGSVALSFTRPPDPVLPQFLAASAADASFSATLNHDTCPATPTGTHYQWDSSLEHLDFGKLSPGRYCVEVWAYDGIGRPSEQPATLTVDVPS